MGDDNDTDIKKNAIDYLEHCMISREEFLKKVISSFGERVTKQELVTKIRPNFFKSYDLRLGISGKSLKPPAK